jgi:hypothetical protein
VLNVRGGFARIAPLLFARAKDDKAGTVAQNDKTSISDADYAAVIDRVKTVFAKRAGGALTVGIEPVGGSDLAPALQKSARRRQLGLGKGAYWENVAYVVQQAHGTPVEVEKTIYELYGHAATEILFSGTWVAKQNELLKAIGSGGGCTGSLRRTRSPCTTTPPTWLPTAQRDHDGRAADMAEKKAVLRRKANLFVGAVRAWLRAHGFRRAGRIRQHRPGAPAGEPHLVQRLGKDRI